MFSWGRYVSFLMVLVTVVLISYIVWLVPMKREAPVSVPTPINLNTQSEPPVTQPITGTVLEDFERKYLLWFLLQREEAGFESVSVRHYTTEVIEGCPECYMLYYAWGDPPVLVQIIITNENVEKAFDETGYDYLTDTQGIPSRFQEVRTE